MLTTAQLKEYFGDIKTLFPLDSNDDIYYMDIRATQDVKEVYRETMDKLKDMAQRHSLELSFSRQLFVPQQARSHSAYYRIFVKIVPKKQ